MRMRVRSQTGFFSSLLKAEDDLIGDGNSLDSRGGDEVIIFKANHAFAWKDEFRLDSHDHPLGKGLMKERRDDRVFVNLKTEAVTDEFDLAFSMSHEKIR